MSKENKITEEELKNLQELLGKLNSASNQLGNIEMQKHQLLHASQSLQNDLNTMQKTLEETYGKVNVNIQDGTYVAIEEEPKLELDKTEE
tara:strand:+ start:146 stop:415 length:270 start_codon:yes stop_codon:yes gene_type:complete